ncbi:hypothetical protein L226DRAFT_596236 [Lentinus tigrinus ALCF2SS1-7]|uniref:uncharacterized protein n=1 Tax=Lentinus tigrinus ALCF2SS1-7 TaxID=1328758 RepID=UPI0011660A1A|nr:hypothetical protein L226DRAFT_596236 [Lentinus tigrinus ALCF2SS1-7]
MPPQYLLLTSTSALHHHPRASRRSHGLLLTRAPQLLLKERLSSLRSPMARGLAYVHPTVTGRPGFPGERKWDKGFEFDKTGRAAKRPADQPERGGCARAQRRPCGPTAPVSPGACTARTRTGSCWTRSTRGVRTSKAASCSSSGARARCFWGVDGRGDSSVEGCILWERGIILVAESRTGPRATRV